MEISFKTKDKPEVRKANFEMPADLDGLVAKFGAENVYDNAVGSYVISLQALGRRHIEKDDAEIQGLFDSWDPNTGAPRVKQTAFERATSALKNLSDEEKAELLARLQG